MIIGRLTADPEGRTTPQGTSVSSFRVATNFTWTDANGARQERVEYHGIVVWRKLAEICNQYLRKGSKVYIEGRLQTRDWEGQDGVKKYKTEIVADNMIMLDRAGASTSSGGSANFEPVATSAVATEIPTANNQADEEIKVEDIPF